MTYKIRKSNLELYRIILMLFIIAHHYVVNSGITDIMKENYDSWRTLFYWIFGMWGKTGINCFVLITGYFMCTSKITLRKFLKLVLEVEFYNIVIFFIFLLSGYRELTYKGLFYAFFPISSVSSGFTSCFILFYLCIPFLNVLVSNMDNRTHKLAIMLGLLIYTVFGMMPGIDVKMNYVSWFCILYLIASYIRLRDDLFICGSNNWGKYLLLSLCVTILTSVLFFGIGHYKEHFISVIYFVKDCNYLLSIVVSICAFNYFRTLKIPQSKFVNMMGASTFGVLLIHANSNTMRQWLWKDVLNVSGQYYSEYFILHAILSVLIIYITCVIIDQMRIRFIETPVFIYIDKIIDKFCGGEIKR